MQLAALWGVSTPLIIAFVLVILGLVHSTAGGGRQKFLLFLQDSQGG